MSTIMHLKISLEIIKWFGQVVVIKYHWQSLSVVGMENAVCISKIYSECDHSLTN